MWQAGQHPTVRIVAWGPTEDASIPMFTGMMDTSALKRERESQAADANRQKSRIRGGANNIPNCQRVIKITKLASIKYIRLSGFYNRAILIREIK